jgi:hypothetical protein
MKKNSNASVHLNFGPEGKTTPGKELTETFIPVLFPQQVAPKVKVAFNHDRIIDFQGQLRYIAAEVTGRPKQRAAGTISNALFNETTG